MANIRVRKFEQDDISQVRGEFFREVIRKVPPIIGTELPEETVQHCEDEALKLVDQGLSLVAEDTDTGKVVGFFINQVAEPKIFSQNDEQHGQVTFATFMELKGEICRKSKMLEKYPQAKKMLNMYLLYVKEDYGGKGIGRRLVEGSLDVALSNGFDIAFAVAASHFTYRLGVKMECEALYKVRYDEWKRADGTPASQVFNLEAQGVHQECVFICKYLGQ